MLCNYGCGQEGIYQFKNGKWCCSKNFRLCPNMKNKGVRDTTKPNKKLACEYCGRLIAYTSIKKHKNACPLNPKNIKKCKFCSQVLTNRENAFCSKSCSASYNNTRRKHSEQTKDKIKKA